jgi:glycosyltransferase involved in cell wall biosynthesis
MNKLTAIIPFLNEGIEIEQTLASIRETAGDEVDIIVINDNSHDDTDYETVAGKYVYNQKLKQHARNII